MTTALLSSVELEATGGAARTVLGFVLSELARVNDKEVLTDGKANWVLPTQLVDFFQGMLGLELGSMRLPWRL